MSKTHSLDSVKHEAQISHDEWMALLPGEKLVLIYAYTDDVDVQTELIRRAKIDLTSIDDPHVVPTTSSNIAHQMLGHDELGVTHLVADFQVPATEDINRDYSWYAKCFVIPNAAAAEPIEHPDPRYTGSIYPVNVGLHEVEDPNRKATGTRLLATESFVPVRIYQLDAGRQRTGKSKCAVVHRTLRKWIVRRDKDGEYVYNDRGYVVTTELYDCAIRFFPDATEVAAFITEMRGALELAKSRQLLPPDVEWDDAPSAAEVAATGQDTVPFDG